MGHAGTCGRAAPSHLPITSTSFTHAALAADISLVALPPVYLSRIATGCARLGIQQTQYQLRLSAALYLMPGGVAIGVWA